MTPGLPLHHSITSSLHHSITPSFLTHSVSAHWIPCQAVRKQSFGGYWVAKKLSKIGWL